MLARILICFIATLLLFGRAHAQPVIPSPFYQGSFEDADRLAREQKRLHLVYLDLDNAAFEKAEARLWGNRTLGHWIQWHAVLSRVSRLEDPELFNIFESGLQECGRSSSEGLIIIVLRDGKTEQIIPVFKPLLPALSDPEPGRLAAKPTEVLFQSNFVLEKLAATDPVWLVGHEHKNPPPPAPPRVWFSTIEDVNAPACAGPAQGQHVLSMLVEARAQISRGELHEATGTYTWLWEHLDEGRPWLKPLRRTIVAAEMSELAWKRAGSRARFVAIRDDHVARDAWADLPEQLDRYIMDEVVGETEQSLMELAYAMIDEDEGSLIPYHQRAGLELISACTPVLNQPSNTAEQERRVASLHKPISRPKQSLATDEEWSYLVELRRQILLMEVCRSHIAALRARNDALATRIAADLLKHDTDGFARLALASMAWASGLADQRHITWVHEAVALGADDAGLLPLLAPPVPAATAP